MLDSREAILADNVQNDPQYATRDSIRELKAGSLICVPVIDDDVVIGLIHLYTSAHAAVHGRRPGVRGRRWPADGRPSGPSFAGRTR